MLEDENKNIRQYTELSDTLATQAKELNLPFLPTQDLSLIYNLIVEAKIRIASDSAKAETKAHHELALSLAVQAHQSVVDTMQRLYTDEKATYQETINKLSWDNKALAEQNVRMKHLLDIAEPALREYERIKDDYKSIKSTHDIKSVLGALCDGIRTMRGR